MFLSSSKKSNLLCLQKPVTSPPLDGYESVRCERGMCCVGSRTRLHCCVAFWLSSVSALSAPQEYEEDAREFKLKVNDTDRQLGAVFCQAFDDASGLEHAFKV